MTHATAAAASSFAAASSACDSKSDEENGEPTDALNLFRWLSREVHELTPRVARLHGAPTSIVFLREHVASNRPCVVSGALNHWPALDKWTARGQGPAPTRPLAVVFYLPATEATTEATALIPS
jgi:hypothetical protein